MLKRSAYDKLLKWKASGARKALLVDGARQIGKTYLIEHFGHAEYADLVKVDFIADEHAADLLGSARDARQVIERLSLLAGKRLIPGQTLVFFDEVQEAPNLVAFSKYLVDDGRFDLVMSGSMLGVELSAVKSFPVGYLHVEHMYPLTFQEFCWALGVPDGVLSDVAACCRELRAVDEAVHERFIDLFRLYVVIGGMPEAIQSYLDAGYDLGAAREVQNDLVTLYREDIAKYAGGRALQVKAIYDALPGQLAKENKRFELRTLQNQARFERYANDFAWLVQACAALKTLNVREPKHMLARTQEESRFKLYQSDVGMLMSRYATSVAAAALAGSRDVNFGAVYENAVAQEILAAGCPLRYYHNSRKGEVDFLVETQDGAVLPVEVKSGKSYKLHTALNNLLGSPEYGIEEAVVLSDANVSTGERAGKRVRYLPLYMAGIIAHDAMADASPTRVVAPPTWDEAPVPGHASAPR